MLNVALGVTVGFDWEKMRDSSKGQELVDAYMEEGDFAPACVPD